MRRFSAAWFVRAALGDLAVSLMAHDWRTELRVFGEDLAAAAKSFGATLVLRRIQRAREVNAALGLKQDAPHPWGN